MNRCLPFLPLLLAFSLARAQTLPLVDERADDRAALWELGAKYEQAINEGNLRSLAPLVSPEASAVFATNDEMQGLDAMQKYFDEMKSRLGQGSSYQVKLKPDRTQFFGDIALAHGSSDEVARLGSGKEYHLSTRWTAVLRKEPGGWKAKRLHVSMNPLENAILTAREQTRLWLAVGSGVFAAVGAFVLGRVSKRQK